ncbi:hypothetical protein MHIB_16400 [Mycolicibacter hiberniae]|uniref:Uncharacterized protein n=1 Tax=Mycolicibacter hiberniae TaxID=29314 RepID=A0A7I7X191_9MYCO|nr:hypothetical protein MHIB_16400 [Mycolicibacter hiberniae]
MAIAAQFAAAASNGAEPGPAYMFAELTSGGSAPKSMKAPAPHTPVMDDPPESRPATPCPGGSRTSRSQLMLGLEANPLPRSPAATYAAVRGRHRPASVAAQGRPRAAQDGFSPPHTAQMT